MTTTLRPTPVPTGYRTLAGLPTQAGVGFKPQHFDALIADPSPPGFIEIHAENYFGAGGAPHAQLQRVRERLPLSVHGVGLSIGGEEPIDETHLSRLAALLRRCEPASFSEHLAWSSHGGTYYNDLLPIVYDARSLQRVCDHVDRVQARLGMRLLLENPATYLEFADSDIPEPDFLTAVIGRTGCGLLLDINNIHVTCHNHGHDPRAYLAALPLHAVGEIHLAGHALDADAAGALLIDSHGGPVDDAVWALFDEALALIGAVPTLIEWDNNVPDYARLVAEAREADRVLANITGPLATRTA